MNELLLGVARKVITPEVGCALMGYRPDIFSESVNDDLTATAFVFKQGDTSALMISLTLCSLRTDIAEKILANVEKEYGIPRANSIIHTIHTHSGPRVNGPDPKPGSNGTGGGWGELNVEYVENILIPSVMEVVKEAAANPVSVQMKVSVGESYVAINRRELNIENKIVLGQNPWGPIDPKMTVISFINEEKKNVANIIHYAAHGTGSGPNHEITRDWAGVMIDVLERASGGITAFFNGPEGDVGPRLSNGKTTGDLRYALELGGKAAQDAVRIYKQHSICTTPILSASTETIDVPLAHRIPKEEAEAGCELYKGKTINIAGRKASYFNRVLRSYEDGYTEIDSVSFEQTIIRLGDVAFISFPYELFSEVGMRIAQASDIPYTLSLSISNGAKGYFVTEDAVPRGGYEVEMFQTANLQPYVHDADFRLMKSTLEHLKKV
ncbi:MAG: neutral/alkaline non-lysosomal ceramidase N-terminal domain-containing protein [Clostridia bacterium]|nr:neutral/alkaline non-lysosomal ceramidase N-terminal domain-containing protein [Clostridia bacterium]MBR3714405.1 neutral/alkaline non-lysosomal ceramidase N-terminal domain-containing protein [Clostridia bacterium]